jgi:hypothetical protein
MNIIPLLAFGQVILDAKVYIDDMDYDLISSEKTKAIMELLHKGEIERTEAVDKIEEVIKEILVERIWQNKYFDIQNVEMISNIKINRIRLNNLIEKLVNKKF